MKIQNNSQQSGDQAQVLAALRELTRQPSDAQARPCPNCHVAIDPGSASPAAKCSSQCQYAPRVMSGEPDKFPIEAAIVPLVYALYSLRLVTPCWSCEGHMGEGGKIGKLPKVWFYSSSSFYPRMIAQIIGQMQAHHKIGYSWIVRVLPFSQSTYSTTYSIEATPSDATLKDLHGDIRVLSQHLRQDMMVMAHDYLRREGQ